MLICMCAQVITQHEPGELIVEDTGLGIERTDGLVMIQVSSSRYSNPPYPFFLFPTLNIDMCADLPTRPRCRQEAGTICGARREAGEGVWS